MLVVDVDEGRLLHCYGDEHSIIPRKLHKALVTAIKQDSSSGNVAVIHTTAVLLIGPPLDTSALDANTPALHGDVLCNSA